MKQVKTKLVAQLYKELNKSQSTYKLVNFGVWIHMFISITYADDY